MCDYQKVFTEQQASLRTSLSVRSLQRKRQDGTGPKFIMLSSRRIGYTAEAIDEFLRQREVASTSAATMLADARA